MSENSPKPRGRKPQQPNHRAVTFRVPKDLHALFTQVAAANRRTVTAELQVAMEAHVAGFSPEESSDAA